MITRPKGTYDLLKEDSVIYNNLLGAWIEICDLNNYKFIKTPTFEASSLFHRGVGETTDIVTKETYDFKDRGNRDITLRPEGTAGIVRAIIENKLYANTNNYLKYYYYGPMFRYERPQSGRFREFNQLGIEVFGNVSPYVDAEVINLGIKYFNSLKIDNVTIKINNLGSKEDREKYKKVLVEYLKKHEDELCEDCKTRLETNPLRALDCKKDADKEFFKNMPKISDYISDEGKKYFEELLSNLEALDIEYEIDEKLVRGLDYYDYAVFEYVTSDERLAGASTICGGGRYNNLVKNLGGPDLAGVGFAVGYERLATIVKSLDLVDLKDAIDVYIAPIDAKNISDALIIGTDLRDAGFKCEIDYRDTNFKNKMSTASKMNASFAVIIGEEELKDYSVVLKDLKTKEEKKISINNLADELYINF